MSSTVLPQRTPAQGVPFRALALLAAALLGAVGLLWFALRAAPPLTLNMGEAASGRFVSGFYPPEAGDGYRFRWSGPEARFLLHGASPATGVLTLLFHGDQLSIQDDPSLSLTHGTAVLAQFVAQPGWRRYQVLLPPASVATATSVPVPLEVRSALPRPGQSVGDFDLRPLGIALAQLEWRALPPPHTPALARALWLTWLASVIAAGLTVGVRLVRPSLPRSTLRVGAAGLLILTAALLAFAAWRAPFDLAWALPPMPWMLASVSLLVAILAVVPVNWGTPSGSQADERAKPTPAHVLGGMGLLALAGGMFATQVPFLLGLGAALALLALLLLSVGPHGLGAQLWAAPAADLPRRKAMLLLGLIFLLALGLRLFRLDELPFGLWRDEARHGLFAQRIRDFPGYRPIYIASERVNMPALGLYPFAVALWLWGEEIWAMRVVTGVAGALTVLPLYLCATMLTRRRSVGLLAALLLAVSTWHIAVGRLAFPTIFDPLLTLSALALLLFALQAPNSQPPRLGSLRLVAALGAGALLGLAVQTYHTGRVAPIVAIWLGLLILLYDRQHWRQWLLLGAATLVALLLTLGPLLAYALNQPAAFNDRVSAVFLLSPEALRGQAPLAALDEAVGLHVQMFHVAGDENGRHHVPDRPMLDYLSGLGLLLGLAALLRQPLAWRTLFLLGAVVISLLPGLLSVDAPHGLRAFAALAFVIIIAAVGWVSFGDLLRVSLPQLRPGLMRAMATGLVVALMSLNSIIYFVIMPPQREAYLVFYPVQSQMGVYVRALAKQPTPPAQIFVPAGLPEDPVFAFLVSGIPIETFAGDQLSAPLQPGAVFLLTGYFAEQEAAGLAPILGPNPEPTALGPLLPDGSMRTFYVYMPLER